MTSPVTTVEDVRRMIHEAQSRPNGLVLYFHGGLTDKDKGLQDAATLLPGFLSAGAFPVFLVWESGFIDSLLNSTGGRASLIIDRLVAAFEQLEWTEQVESLFDGPVDRLARLREHLASVLVGDVELRDAAVRAAELPARERSIIYPNIGGVPGESLSRATYRAFFAADPPLSDLSTHPQPGLLFDPVERIVLFAMGLLKPLLRREAYGRLHGKAQSVSEEILRRIGLGGYCWDQMKAFADRNFMVGDPAAGTPDGAMTILLNELARLESEQGAPAERVTLIAHSAGSIIACNFIEQFRELGLKAELNVVFLAPAVTYERLARALGGEADRPVIHGFRMFTMGDEHERQDTIYGVYRHSLLYLVSGAFESRLDLGINVVADVPLAGMRRFSQYERFSPGSTPRKGWPGQSWPYVSLDEFRSIELVEKYLHVPGRLVATPTGVPPVPGFESAADSHGGFTAATLDSLAHIIKNGLSPIREQSAAARIKENHETLRRKAKERSRLTPR